MNEILNYKKLAVGENKSILFIISIENLNIDLQNNNNKEFLYKINQLKNNNLIICFVPGDIIIISLDQNNYKILKNIVDAHTDGVYNVIIELENEKFLSCSNDKSLKIWANNNDNKKYEEIYIRRRLWYIYITEIKKMKWCMIII